jgi:hypothetical protein
MKKARLVFTRLAFSIHYGDSEKKAAREGFEASHDRLDLPCAIGIPEIREVSRCEGKSHWPMFDHGGLWKLVEPVPIRWVERLQFVRGPLKHPLRRLQGALAKLIGRWKPFTSC